MLISFSLTNFKGFKKLEPIALKPLTLICGANNSGKSSIIQSLLLMKQSYASRRTASFEADIQTPLILDGENVPTHLGDWADVIYKQDTTKKMSLTWQLCGDLSDDEKPPVENNNSHLEVEIEVEIEHIENKTHGSQLAVCQFQFREKNTNFSFELTKAQSEKYTLKLTGIYLPDFLLTWIYQRQAAEIFDFKWTDTLFAQTVIDEIHFIDILVEFNGIFPHALTGDFAKQSYETLTRVRKELKPRGKKPKYLAFIDKTLTALNNQKAKSQGKVYPFHPQQRVNLTTESYLFATQSLQKFWFSFRYIGPLREEPSRFYFFDEIGKMNIGFKGEKTPLVLGVEQKQRLPAYYKCIYDGKRIKAYELREADNLMEALNGWLSFMKLPQLIPTPALKRNINQIKLEAAGVEVCLPDVGFGVSQILPILVECLRTKKGETLILEQPEIHLHPSLQSKLADFLICMAKAGKKIIVETHSEHLIKRLYLRVAQEESNDTRNLLNTIFVSFDEQQQTSVTQPIVINEYGEIENWPIGFFDEDDSREMVAATLKKRMRNMK
jgi:predicted ATPase